MNVLRSLMRDVVNLVSSEATKAPTEAGLRKALDQRVVPAVINLGRYRDSFEQPAQRPFDQPAPTSGGPRNKPSWRALSVSTTPERFSGTSTSTFSHPNADGFEPARRRPVELIGRSLSAVVVPPLPNRASKKFTASLADL
jgi:hypothetical protein